MQNFLVLRRKSLMAVTIATLFALLFSLSGPVKAVDSTPLHVDGDSIDSNGGNLPDDWDTVIGQNCDLNEVGGAVNKATCVTDPLTGDQGFHTGGSKDINDLNQWGWSGASGTQTPPKNNIVHAFGAVYNNNGNQILYFGLDREPNNDNGNNTVGFWFLQKKVGLGAGGAFVDGNNNPATHTDGDLHVVAEFTNGGSISNLRLNKWQAGALTNVFNTNPGTNTGCNTTVPFDTVCVGVNNTSTPLSWVGAVNPSIFFEGGINLTALGFSATSCLSQFIAETRSSQSDSAQLHDFALGDLSTCGTITIIKDAIPNSAQDFGFTSNIPGSNAFNLDDDSDGTLSNTKVITGINPGSYTVTESAVAGWDLTGLVCNDNAAQDSQVNLQSRTATINLNASESVTCTFTNTQQKGTIVVDKVTNPANDPQSFNFDASGGSYADFSLTHAAQPNSQILDPGTYSVSETVPSGWDQTSATCVSSLGQQEVETIGNLELDPNETITCTFTNTKRGTIIVEKQTSPDQAVGNFTFTGNATGTISDGGMITVNNLIPGTYTSTENDPLPNFALTGIVCDDGSSATPSTVSVPNRTATFKLDAGETIKCTFTNTQQQGKLKVIKHTQGGDGIFPISITGPTPSTPSITTTGGIGDTGELSVNVGTYNVTETVPTGWDQTANTCVDVQVVAGQTATCEITNVKRGRIIVNKVTVGGTATFDFTTTGTGYTGFSISGGQSNNQEVVPGAYSVSETAKTGWILTSATCDQGETPASLDVLPGETVTCTFTNTKKPTLTVNKVVVPANDNGKFNLQIDGVNKATDVGNGGTTGAQEVTIGDHTVSEIAGTGTSLSDYTAVISGDCNPDTGVVTLAAGENKVCTITNTRKGSITIKKVTVGGDSSFTFTGDVAGSLSNNQTSSATVVAGTYSSTEGAVAGWDLTNITCDDNDSTGNVQTGVATFNVAAGENVTCTFTNTKRGEIVLVKNTVGGEGTFNFVHQIPGLDTNLTTVAGTDTDTSDKLVPGDYSISETVPDGWDLTSSTCDKGETVENITVEAGETVTCTFTNTKRGEIVLIKNTVGGDGTFNFVHQIPGLDSSLTTTAGTKTDTSDKLVPGDYSISETVPAGWDLTSATCDKEETIGNITVGAGETVTCTFTNTKRGHIIVNKVTDPVGDLQSFDFTTTGSGYNGFSLTDGNSNNQEVAPGAYSVSETAIAGWDLTSATCDKGETPASLDVEPGETVTCTFNNQKDAKIIVEKQTLPDGSETSFEFDVNYAANFFLKDGEQNNSGDLDPGTYSVDELTPAGWDETLAVCTSSQQGDASTPGSISLQAGETVTCVFTNTQRGHVVIIKDALPNSAQDFSFTGSEGIGAFLLDDDNNGTLPNQRDFEVLPGKYSVTEAAVAGWEFDGAVCDKDETADDIDVAPGETVTCTFTNEKLAKLTLVKNTIGGNGTFDFVMTGATLAPSAQLITASGTASQVFDNLDPDNTYTINETPIPAGWANTSATCSGNHTPGNINPNSGEEIVCTFVNNKPAAKITLSPLTATNKIGDNHVITANVQVHSGDGAWGPAANGTVVTFTITNSLGATATFVGGNTCATAAGSCSITINSPTPGHVVVNGTASPTVLGVVVTATSGTGGDNSADAQKDYVDARISIETSATNEVGDPHTFTVKVEKNIGNGFVGVAGVNPVVVFTPNAPGTVTDNCASTGTDVDGKCTVVVNSNIAGVFTATASANITVNTVQFNLITDGQNGNPSPAVKTYVDAKIALDPLTATNNVNVPHTFTVKLMKDPGTGYVAASGEHVDFTLTPAGGATPVLDAGTSTCDNAGPNTDVNGECTIVFNSATPGTVTVHAKSTLSVGGVSLTRETDSTHGSTGDAVKTYVAGKIIVIKQTLPDGSTQSFEFNPSWSESNFNLKDGESNDSGFIAPGAYSVSETVPSGWDQTSATCDLGETVDSIDVGAGETVTCTFTNTQRGHLIVQKTTDPAADETVFTISASGTGTITGGGAGTVTDALDKDYEVTPGTYSVSETVPQGWDKTGDTCQNVTVAAGETKYCLLTNTKRGSLKVTKTVIFGDLVNSGSVTQNFNITITGPSYPSGNTKTINQNGGDLLWENLLPGQYTVTEGTLGAEWSVNVSGSPATVPAGGQGEATVTNTYVPGKLDVTKAVVTTGYLFANDYDQTFTIKVSGPSYPLPGGTDLVFNVVNGVLNPSTQSLENLIPGTYTVTEADPGVMWTVTGNGNVSVVAGQTASKTVTNTIKLPSTRITLTPDVWETTPGGNVTLTITDTNNGAVPITNPSVQLLANNVPTLPQPTFVSESGTVNGIMDVGETWTWTWTGAINVETVFTVNGIGTDPLGNPVNGPTYSSETTSQTIRVIGATRTIGFWQTHTTFTSYVFGLASMQKFVGEDVPVSLVNPITHKGQISNTQTAGASQLFGAFYAPIAKTTSGAKRSAIDQARIQMLQQLVGAKLNCAAFGCSAATITLIANADAAYKAGANKNTIIALAGQLDAFNNSGDNIAIDPLLPPTGKATPKASQALADLAFWNNP